MFRSLSKWLGGKSSVQAKTRQQQPRGRVLLSVEHLETRLVPALPFSDIFTTVTSPEPHQLTSNWVNQAGNFFVNTSAGTATGIGGLDLATVIGATAPDVAVQATIALIK